MFVLGAYLSPTLVDEPTRCSVLAMFFHYFFLCQFTWMFIEVMYLWFIWGGIAFGFRRKETLSRKRERSKKYSSLFKTLSLPSFVFLSRKNCSTFYLANQLHIVLPTNFGGMNIHTFIWAIITYLTQGKNGDRKAVDDSSMLFSFFKPRAEVPQFGPLVQYNTCTFTFATLETSRCVGSK